MSDHQLVVLLPPVVRQCRHAGRTGGGPGHEPMVVHGMVHGMTVPCKTHWRGAYMHANTHTHRHTHTADWMTTMTSKQANQTDLVKGAAGV